jgi:hypothetical protein
VERRQHWLYRTFLLDSGNRSRTQTATKTDSTDLDRQFGFGCRPAPVARLGDGWLASLYNTMPDQFAAALAKLRDQLKIFGKDPASFPNALVTMFMYITEDKFETERVLSETLTALLNRPVDQLRERLLVGSPEVCAKKLAAYKPPVFNESLCGR